MHYIYNPYGKQLKGVTCIKETLKRLKFTIIPFWGMYTRKNHKTNYKNKIVHTTTKKFPKCLRITKYHSPVTK